MKSVWMQDMSWEDVRDYLAHEDIVIVPIGSTETHGPHLPLGVDSFEAIDYAEGIAQQAGVLVTPPIWYGDSSHHMHQPGTISIRPETVIALLADVYRSLVEHGFKSIITFNGHRLANLPAIGYAARAVKEEHPEVIFAVMDPLVMAAETHRAIREAPGEGTHGDEFETSHMLFKRPELVRRDKIVRHWGEPFPSRFVANAHDPYASGDKIIFIVTRHDQARVTPFGHIGDPTKASADKGKQLWDAIVANGSEFIADLRRHRA